ncbi:hypothetical protein D3C81_1492390 [compost metagenome]
MHLHGQIVVTVQQFNQQRKPSACFRNAFAAEPFLSELLTDLVEALSGQFAVYDGRDAVRMIGDHPAFANVALRQVKAEFLQGTAAPHAFFELRLKLEWIWFCHHSIFLSVFNNAVLYLLRLDSKNSSFSPSGPSKKK